MEVTFGFGCPWCWPGVFYHITIFLGLEHKVLETSLHIVTAAAVTLLYSTVECGGSGVFGGAAVRASDF